MDTQKTLAILVPAHNEIKVIGPALTSMLNQSQPANMIVVVDDGSDDGTGDFIRENFPSVIVIRPEKNLGSKAYAQNWGLAYKKEDGSFLVDTDFIVTVDADTSLDYDGLELLSKPMRQDSNIKAACGTVIPQNLDNPYTMGRLAEYLFAFAFPKRIQDYLDSVMIVSGCFGCYDAEVLRARGGWHTNTMAEDMDLTASYHRDGHKMRFVQEAVCRPVEPFNWKTYSAQLTRWSAAWFQNVSVHWKTYATRRVGFFALISYLDAGVGGVMYLILPLLFLILGWQQWLIGFLVGDVLLISIPIIYMGRKLNMTKLAIMSIPFLFFLRYLNIYFWFRALWKEWILGDHLNVYVKGH